MLTPHVSLLLSACGPGGVVPDGVCAVVHGVGTAIGDAGSFASDVAEAVQNPFRWFYHHTLGLPLPQSPADPGWAACQQDWASSQCPKLVDSLRPDAVPLPGEWPRLYGTFAVSGMFIAATSCVARVVRALFDERTAGLQLVTDAVVRLTLVAGLLLAPSPDHSLLLTIVTWLVGASADVAGAAATAIAHAFAVTGGLGGVVDRIASAGFDAGPVGDFLVAVPVLLAALGVLYMLGLSLLRVIQLVFAVATAPLFVGVAVFDVRNRFVQWWLGLMTSALVLPLVLAVCGTLTGAVALLLLGGPSAGVSVGGGIGVETRTIVASFAVLGGVWMTGRSVHGLAWRGFSHGGFTGALTAASTSVMAVPNLLGSVGGAARMTTRLSRRDSPVSRPPGADRVPVLRAPAASAWRESAGPDAVAAAVALHAPAAPLHAPAARAVRPGFPADGPPR